MQLSHILTYAGFIIMQAPSVTSTCIPESIITSSLLALAFTPRTYQVQSEQTLLSFPRLWSRAYYYRNIHSEGHAKNNFYPSQCQQGHQTWVPPPFRHGWSVIDFWGWEAHETHQVISDIWIWGATEVVNSNYTKLSRQSSSWVSYLWREIFLAKSGIEPWIISSVVRNSDH